MATKARSRQNTKNSDHEKINLLLRLAEFQAKRLDERRNHSWKITFGFWAAILGSLALIETIGPETSVQCTYGLGAGALLLHGLWLVKVFEADKRDKITAFVARDKAMQLLDLVPPERDIEKRKFYADWSVQFQFATTTFLIVIVVTFFSFR